jgi:hypothetical protein
MKYSIALAALAALAAVTVEAQAPKGKGKGKGKCQRTKDVKPAEDPLVQFSPGSAVFPCDFGAGIPLGKVPKGCAKLEIIVG